MIEDLKTRPTMSYIVEQLMEAYGCDTTLGELFLKLTKGKGYRCAKCEGKGYVLVKYNAHYPHSGYESDYRDKECNLCNGTGFTDKPMKPRMVQIGWEVDE